MTRLSKNFESEEIEEKRIRINGIEVEVKEKNKKKGVENIEKLEKKLEKKTIQKKKNIDDLNETSQELKRFDNLYFNFIFEIYSKLILNNFHQNKENSFKLSILKKIIRFYKTETKKVTEK